MSRCSKHIRWGCRRPWDGVSCQRLVLGTLILMAEGTAKPIADVQVGEMGLAADPETGERGLRRVTDTIVGDGIRSR